ncbi:MAG: hypothetical protein HYZ54_03060 [Ignavibacteriae bacterium]|nr:hypothetical protein [Ignavibacteriota bacterium]
MEGWKGGIFGFCRLVFGLALAVTRCRPGGGGDVGYHPDSFTILILL